MVRNACTFSQGRTQHRVREVTGLTLASPVQVLRSEKRSPCGLLLSSIPEQNLRKLRVWGL